ncbi:SDR family NAD(P)-dependent oxidoreductase [Candidatus Xianfuyuplasma coldseepsis]|uniref:SDR family NAD(P)-dependent oxidoreductase n=1 Tax=Candidatus Xianfuyuplasma coldseepsis TaxID=2782163 RepID=A0A7L7KSI2_9MOLU|nr:SDR family NAD(P)-dependent oxidoreductase [Xianfuyuplasma coldseepsis]QMS85222.1 SDR family NAD(P)-dependent oxidoreductase [Xianfuyuplasma coldseepsis]
MKWPEELNFIPVSRMPQKQSTVDMNGKTVIISGATSGVGLAATKRYLEGHAHIVMVVRNQDKAETIKTELLQDTAGTIDIIIADFSDMNSVRHAAHEILATYDTIDVIINSVGMHSTKKRYTKEGREMVFAVNHLGPFLFTQLLIPKLIKQEHGRIIQVNSEGHRFNGLRIHDVDWHKRLYTGLRGYGASKTAQLLTVWELADQLHGTNVTINAMHPGAVKSKIGSNNGLLYRIFNTLFTQPFLKDPKVSGNALYYLGTAPELETVSGRFFNLTNEEIPAKHARNRDLGKKIYELSIQLTNEVTP